MSQPAVAAFLSPPDRKCWRDHLPALFPDPTERYLIALVTLVLDSRCARHSLPVNVFLRSIFSLRAKPAESSIVITVHAGGLIHNACPSLLLSLKSSGVLGIPASTPSLSLLLPSILAVLELQM